MPSSLRTIVLSFTFFVSLLAAAHAQQWPAKPVKMIVPYPPAGAVDIATRTIAEKLAKELGQTFVTENKPGAAGVLGMELAARSAPDGYTFAVIPDIIASAPHIYKLTFEPQKELVPVIQVSQQPLVIAAHPSIGVASLAELVALAKSKPGMGYATSGIGTQQHINGEWFAKLAGIELKHIPFKGGGQAINDVVAGQVPLASLGSSPLLPHHKTGALRLLAQTTATRAPTLKDVPTMRELGYDLVLDQWIGVFAPSGTPQPIVDRLNAAVNRALKEADVLERFDRAALEAVGGTPEKLASLAKADLEKYGRLIKELKIEIDR